MLCIKEVELVDSVDELKSSCSVTGIRMPDFEVLDARNASADGQGDGVPKAGQEQAAGDSQGSRTCVCANTFAIWVGTCRREG